LYSEIGDCERKKRMLQWVFCRLYPFDCWIIIKKGPGNFFGGHSPHWVNHIYLCLYCIEYLLCFILLLHDLVFLQLVSERKVTRRKRGFLVRVGAMSGDGKFRVEKFKGQNYHLWKMKMEDYLYQKDLFLPFGGIENKLTTMKDEEWDILDIKALGMIRLSLTTSVAFNISK
jgi:hypothetical protein